MGSAWELSRQFGGHALGGLATRRKNEDRPEIFS